MKGQPGFISTQLHRGIAGSGVFLNYAVWQSEEHFRAAFANTAIRARLADYPEGATVSPHLFTKSRCPASACREQQQDRCPASRLGPVGRRGLRGLLTGRLRG